MRKNKRVKQVIQKMNNSQAIQADIFNSNIFNITINSNDSHHKNLDILIPSKFQDMVYKGLPNNWIHILDLYKNLFKCENPEPQELLRLIVTYDIGRVRRLEDSKDEVVFLDTSWLSHNYSHWNENDEMNRWLLNLSEIGKIRAKKNLKTTRAFFWKPNEIHSHETVFEIMKTINAHLSFGINVYLTEPTDICLPKDVQLFSKKDGIISNDFTNYEFSQIEKSSEIDSARELYEIIKKNIRDNKTIALGINDSGNYIRKIIEEKCINIQ